MAKRPQFIILRGNGINCENETKRVVEEARGKAIIISLEELVKKKKLLKESQGFIIPGGFSFGDDLGSGQIMALKLRQYLEAELLEFVAQKKYILGICNGFQVLIKLGLLPLGRNNQEKNLNHQGLIGLAPNKNEKFMNRWVKVYWNEKSPCRWTRYLPREYFSIAHENYLPVRHQEGRVVFALGKEKSISKTLEEQELVVIRYAEEVNGSQLDIAGLCDPTGYVLGLMPHPEAASIKLLNPREFEKSPQNSEKDMGHYLFQSAIMQIKNS